MSELVTRKHAFVATAYDHLAVHEKYLFKTDSSPVSLNIRAHSNSNFLLSINKCDDVTQEGIHIPSFTLNDNDEAIAECEVYKNPTYTIATLWNQTWVTPEALEVLNGNLHARLAPNSTYIILSKEPVPSAAAYYLLQFNWSEER